MGWNTHASLRARYSMMEQEYNTLCICTNAGYTEYKWNLHDYGVRIHQDNVAPTGPGALRNEEIARRALRDA